MKKTLLIMVALLSLPWQAMGDQDIFEVMIICPDNFNFRVEYARMITDEFLAVGIDASLKFLPMDEMIERCFDSNGKRYKNGGFDIALFGWRLSGVVDADDLYYLYHSDNSVNVKKGDENTGNIMSWENAENDAFIDKLQQETDESTLKEYWMQWQELFYEEQPVAPIYHVYREVDNEENWSFQHVSFNLNHPVLKKKLVRQALSHLIPRQKICNLHNRDKENQMEGTVTQAKPCAVPVNPDFFAFNDINPCRYDPELAKELLFKAGFKIKTKKHEDAESLLQQAEQAVKTFEFEKAVEYVTQAKQLYQEVGDQGNISLVDDILLNYQDAAETKADAQRFFEEGKRLKEQGDYEAAKENLLKAKEKFQELGMAQDMSEVESVLSDVEELMQKEAVTKEADALFDKGKNAFDKKEYESALDYFQKAKEKYQSVQSEKTAECDQWIAKTEEEMKGICLGTIFLALLIGVGFFGLQRRSS
jgi:tetratricopeptide (TPR) repeat protein